MSRILGPLNVELELPQTMQIEPRFHVNLIQPCSPDSEAFPGQVQEPPPPVVASEQRYEVEAILDSRIHRHRLQYRVQWTGYEEHTWEPAENVDDARDAIEAYHEAYPNKPGPWTRT